MSGIQRFEIDGMIDIAFSEKAGIVFFGGAGPTVGNRVVDGSGIQMST